MTVRTASCVQDEPCRLALDGRLPQNGRLVEALLVTAPHLRKLTVVAQA